VLHPVDAILPKLYALRTKAPNGRGIYPRIAAANAGPFAGL
jgi:hypothetical protein